MVLSSLHSWLSCPSIGGATLFPEIMSLFPPCHIGHLLSAEKPESPVGGEQDSNWWLSFPEGLSIFKFLKILHAKVFLLSPLCDIFRPRKCFRKHAACWELQIDFPFTCQSRCTAAMYHVESWSFRYTLSCRLRFCVLLICLEIKGSLDSNGRPSPTPPAACRGYYKAHPPCTMGSLGATGSRQGEAWDQGSELGKAIWGERRLGRGTKAQDLKHESSLGILQSWLFSEKDKQKNYQRCCAGGTKGPLSSGSSLSGVIQELLWARERVGVSSEPFFYHLPHHFCRSRERLCSCLALTQKLLGMSSSPALPGHFLKGVPLASNIT